MTSSALTAPIIATHATTDRSRSVTTHAPMTIHNTFRGSQSPPRDAPRNRNPALTPTTRPTPPQNHRPHATHRFPWRPARTPTATASLFLVFCVCSSNLSATTTCPSSSPPLSSTPSLHQLLPVPGPPYSSRVGCGHKIHASGPSRSRVCLVESRNRVG